MAHRHKIYPEQRISFFEFWDEVSTSSAKDAFVQYTADINFNPAYVMVSDARNVTNIVTSFRGILHGVEGLRDLLSRFERGTISAVLVSNTTQFGYARMLEQVLDLLSPIRLRIACNEDELRILTQRPDLDLQQLAVGQ